MLPIEDNCRDAYLMELISIRHISKISSLASEAFLRDDHGGYSTLLGLADDSECTEIRIEVSGALQNLSVTSSFNKKRMLEDHGFIQAIFNLMHTASSSSLLASVASACTTATTF